MNLLSLRAVSTAKVDGDEGLPSLLAKSIVLGQRSILLRYSFAVLVTVAMLLIHHKISTDLSNRLMLILLMPPITISALIGGLGPGLFATVLAALGVKYMTILPMHSLWFADSRDLLQWTFLIASGVAVSVVIEIMSRAHRASENHRRLLEAVLDSMNDAVCISDSAGRFIEFNDAFAAFNKFGSKKECAETLDKHSELLEICSANGESLPLEKGPILRALLGETSTGAEFLLRRKDSGDTWMAEYSFAPIRDKDGAIIGSVASGRDITKRKQIEDSLIRSKRELRKLASHLENIREEERTRIARDIHDDVGQHLMVLRIDLSLMAERAGIDSDVKKTVESLLVQLDLTVKSVRSIINCLRPPALNHGLLAAIEWQIKEFKQRSGIVCDFHFYGEDFPLEDKLTTALFRIVQESLSNIMRHAQARKVAIEIHQRKNKGVSLQIIDDGVGFSPDSCERKSSFGLVGIQERVAALKGTISVRSNLGRGTTLLLFVPI